MIVKFCLNLKHFFVIYYFMYDIAVPNLHPTFFSSLEQVTIAVPYLCTCYHCCTISLYLLPLLYHISVPVTIAVPYSLYLLPLLYHISTRPSGYFFSLVPFSELLIICGWSCGEMIKNKFHISSLNCQ